MTQKTARRTVLAGGAGLVAAGLLAAGPAALAQDDYPSRPITVVMMAPAGGATDRGTRPVAELMREHLGAPAVALQDMSGAGGLQAVEYAFTQPADGYTWLGMNDVIESFAMMGRTDYTWKDFDFWMSGGTAAAIVVPSGAGVESWDEFIEWVESQPGELAAATTPSGSLWDAAAKYLKQQTGLDFAIVNYKGGGPATRAVLAGETDFGVIGMTPLVQFIEAGQLTPIAAWTAEDWEVGGTTVPSLTKFIDDPLLARTVPWTNIHGVATIKGVPEDVKAKITEAFEAAMADPSMEDVYADNAFIKFQVSGEEAADLMRERTELQAYILEKITNMAERTRDELGIAKLEEQQ